MKRYYGSIALILLINSVEGFIPRLKDGSYFRSVSFRAHRVGKYDFVADDDRRGFFRAVGGLIGASSCAFSCPSMGQARGLVSFPCVAPLLNVYHLMRAGTSLLEEEDILSTNPLFLTNRESALSQKGVEEVREACRMLQAADISPSVIKYSLGASAVDSAMVIRDELRVGQNRMIPEFTFMDPRALGAWDMMSLREIYPAIVALDEAEAGNDGTGARPPPNVDGTPQDTLADQAIRLRQLMSVLETQFSGDNIVLVFPDGSSPALLSAMIAGIPFNKAHVMDFSPGEIRLDVTMNPTRLLYETRLKNNAEAYGALIKSGKAQLERLRSISDEDLVSKKDLLIEQERIEIEEEYRRQQAVRLEREEQQREGGLARLSNDSNQEHPLDNFSALPLGLTGGSFVVYAALASSRLSRRMESSGREQEGIDITTERAPIGSIQPNLAVMGTSMVPLDNLFDDSQVRSTSLYDPREKSGEERLAEAQEAMQTYMDQDDGGSAWLQAMANIIDEDEEDDFE